MRPFQTMRADDGKEVCLFPFPYMYMSQDEGGDYSHDGTYNLDFLGWGANGRIYQCPFYAPCTLKCVDIFDPSSNTRVYESVEKVHLADGSLDYLTIYFSHDDDPLHDIGDTVNQGQVLGHTGTTGYVTGDHTHTCTGKGTYAGFTQRPPHDWYDLTNRCHYWDACYVNDTVIVEGYGHDWVIYSAPAPGSTKKKHYKFNLFSDILKENRKIEKIDIYK